MTPLPFRYRVALEWLRHAPPAEIQTILESLEPHLDDAHFLAFARAAQRGLTRRGLSVKRIGEEGYFK